jgi:hypothetical protein
MTWKSTLHYSARRSAPTRFFGTSKLVQSQWPSVVSHPWLQRRDEGRYLLDAIPKAGLGRIHVHVRQNVAWLTLVDKVLYLC